MQKIDLLTLFYMLLFGVFLPAQVIKSMRRHRSGAPLPPRAQIWRSVMVMELFLLVVALLTARAAYLDVWSTGDINVGTVLAVLAMLAVALVLQRLIWNATSDELRARLLSARPHEYREMGWWTLISFAAGTVEEIAYRGVMPSLLMATLQRWFGGAADAWTEPLAGELSATWWITVAICVAAFVMAHFGQGWHRTLFLAGFSVACHVLVRVTGSLYPAMALHFVYDVAAGLNAIRFAK